MHMSDIMSPGNAAAFEIAHITELLADRAERLAPLLQVAVKRRVLLHRHVGLATHVAVNDRVAGLLSRIPGLQLVPGPAHPGHMCSALAAVPGALAKAARETWAAAVADGCDTVCTIFHSCHRELAALEGKDGVRVGTGCSSSPRPWGSRPATPIWAGAPAERRTSPPSRGPTRASTTLS